MQQKTSFSVSFPLWEISYIHIYESILGMYHIMFYALKNYRAPSFLFCLYTILYHIKSNWTFISAILTSKFPFFDKKFWQSCDLDWRKSSVATQKRGFFLDALSKANPIFRFGQPPVKFHWKAFVSTVFVEYNSLLKNDQKRV